MFDLAQQSNTKTKAITAKRFESFKREFSFLALQGQTYGQAMCKYFGLSDNLIRFTADPQWIDSYVAKHYVRT